MNPSWTDRPAGATLASAAALVVALVAALAAAAPARAASARLDLDVDPEEARVYLDGKFRGTADDFDDSPDYLWVAPGRHTLELRHPEYDTLRIYFQVASGQELRFDDDLVEAKGAPRLREKNLLPPDPAPAPPAASPAPAPPGDPAANVAFVRFLVEPGDAAVWLDGIFLGPADRFAGNPEMARVAPGRHTFELTRPGYRSAAVEVDLRREQQQTIRLALEPAGE